MRRDLGTIRTYTETFQLAIWGLEIDNPVANNLPTPCVSPVVEMAGGCNRIGSPDAQHIPDVYDLLWSVW